MTQESAAKRTTPPGRKKRILQGLCACAGLYLAYWGSITAMRHQATTLLNSYDLERSLIWMHRLEKIAPQTVGDRSNMLRLHRKLGDSTAFRELADELKQDKAEFVRTQEILFQAQGGGVAAVESTLPSLLVAAANDESGPDICEAFSNGYLASYQLEKAQHLVEGWQKQFPNDPQAHLIRGRLHEHRDDWEAALEAYGQALQCQPGFGPAAFNAARIHSNEDRQHEALKSYEVAASWLLDKAPARLGMARCYRKSGQFDDARTALELALRDSQNTELRQRAFRSVGEAPGTWQTAAQTELGQVELAAENFEAAIKALSAAVDLDPRNFELRYLLARALTGAGERDAAQEHFEAYRDGKAANDRVNELLETVETDGDDPDLRCEIAEILLKYQSEDQAVIWLRGVLQIDPSHQRAHILLADYYTAKSESSGDDTYATLAQQHRSKVRKPDNASDSSAN